MPYRGRMGGDFKKPTAPPPTPMARPRTATIDDPLTTQLLAEVARRAQTVDLDPESLAKLMNEEEEETTAENPHPHLRKRSR